MKPPAVEQPPEQQRYARVLEWASRVGLLVLVLSFAAYLGGLMEAHVPPHKLPELWVHPVDRFIELTGSPRGWGWVRLIHLDRSFHGCTRIDATSLFTVWAGRDFDP